MLSTNLGMVDSRGITTFHEQGELRVLISNLLKAPKNSFRLTIDLPTPSRSILVDEEKICLWTEVKTRPLFVRGRSLTDAILSGLRRTSPFFSQEGSLLWLSRCLSVRMPSLNVS